MARALQDILTELNTVYNPQRDTYNSQLQTIDPQMEAENQGLQAQKQDAFQQITDQANRRGLFYSGLPVQEEQRYTGQQFLPAVANLRAKYASQRFGLQDALAKITADQYNQAYGIRQGELDTEEKARQFNEQLAAQKAASAGSGTGGLDLGSLLGGGNGAAGGAGAQISPLQAAADFAQQMKETALRGGSVPTFYRESVLKQLQQQYGPYLSPQQINDIVYKQIFPDNWAGGGKTTKAVTTGGGGGGSFGGPTTTQIRQAQSGAGQPFGGF